MPPLRKPMKTALPRSRTAATLAKNGQKQALKARQCAPVTESPTTGLAPLQRRDARDHDYDGERQGRRQQAVEPVQQPAMTGDQTARVLDVEAPLGCGFNEIAELRRDTEQHARRHD